MAGQKRPKNVTPQAQVVSPKAVQQLATTTSQETIAVPATPTAPYAGSTTNTALPTSFDTLNQIRINNLGSGDDAGVFASTDKTDGFYNLNFKSFAVSGDLELVETPTTIRLGLKTPEVQPTYIQSGINLNQSGGSVYRGVDGSSLTFRSISVGPNLTIQQTASTIEIGLGFAPATGDVSNASNLGIEGAGIGLFKDKTSGVLNFRRLYSSNNILSLSTDSSDNQLILSVNEAAINLNNLGGVLPANKIAGLHPIATNPDYNILNNKPTIPSRLTDLSDVIGTPQQGQVLRYVLGTGWTPANESGGGNAFGTVKVGLSNLIANSVGADITLAAGSELSVDGDATARRVTYNLKPTGVTAGTYNNASVQVDTFGRIIGIQAGTAPSNNFIDPMTSIGDMIIRTGVGPARLAAGQPDQVLTMGANGIPQWRTNTGGASGSVTSVNVLGDGPVAVTGSAVTSSGTFTVGLKPTGITAGNYSNPTMSVDKWGRITQIANGGTGGSGGGPAVSVKSGYGIQGGGPLTSDVTIALAMTGVTQGEYTNPKIKVDAYGRILEVSSGAGGGSGGGLSSVGIVANGGINVTGSPLTANGNITLTLTNTGVTPGTYGLVNFQVNAQGRITAISPGGVSLNNDLVTTQGEPIIDKTGGIYFSGYTTAELSNKNHPVNTANKDLGKCVINTTNYTLMFATGELPTDLWITNGNTAQITPA